MAVDIPSAKRLRDPGDELRRDQLLPNIVERILSHTE